MHDSCLPADEHLHCTCRDKALALISADGILLLLVSMIDDVLHAFTKGSVIMLV